jgi:plasmid segregation protein ParM
MKGSAMVGGVDVGYGSVKAECGFVDGEAHSILMPSGAGRASLMPRKLNNEPDLKGGESVLVPNGQGSAEEWVAGVDQIHIQHSVRQTHENYTATSEFYALYLAALARFGVDQIDLLITGLPVSQYYGVGAKERIAALEQRMSGRKHISSQVTVDVKKVKVVPQPLGTFMGVVEEPKYRPLATRNDLQTLVIDVGYYSADYVVISGKSVRDTNSGSSTLATSIILEKAAAAVSRRAGKPVSRDQLDMAMKRGSTIVAIGLERELDFAEELRAAAAEVAPQVVGEVLGAMRTVGTVDLVIVTGGGGHLYLDKIREAFPGVDVISPADPVMANAKGYRATGVLMMKMAAART